MPATDLVPCYYTGQRRLVEAPAELRVRAELHECKRQKLGRFVEHGRVFMFFKVMVLKIERLYEGPLGVGNLLPFAKSHSTGDKLHYEMPHAGDRGTFARHHRKRIAVSHRSLFRNQAIA